MVMFCAPFTMVPRWGIRSMETAPCLAKEVKVLPHSPSETMGAPGLPVIHKGRIGPLQAMAEGK